jgi:uncharacterized metal-binding protein YceD (DUF177 family)
MAHFNMKGSYMQKHENKVSAQINLIKLPLNTAYTFELDQSADWVKDILIEMNENATEKTPEAYLAETKLVITGEIEKKNRVEMNEFLLVNGNIQAEYATECVRTLKPMKVNLEIPLKVCFIDESMATSELFADIDETYVENDIYEIYFYQKRTVNFQEMLHEQIFLNYNQYPVLDADAKLLGVDWRNPAKS